MSDEKKTAQPAAEDGPSLAHGPNPALSAQAGTEEQGYSQPEYPEATAAQSVPVSDHGEMDQRKRDRAAGLKHLDEAAKGDPEKEGIHDDGGVKLGASGEEQAASTPNPGEASDGGADDPERHGAGRPSTGPVKQTSGGGPPDASDVPDGGRGVEGGGGTGKAAQSAQPRSGGTASRGGSSGRGTGGKNS